MSQNESVPLIQPPAEFVKQATISGMAAYNALCAEAAKDYTGYWARLAREYLSWKKPFTQVLDESDTPFFKWFADGLFAGTLCFGGEESAGASFLRRDGSVWTTDKDGILLNLLAAEITASTGRDPGQHYNDLTERFGNPVYKRIDAKANTAQKKVLKSLSPEDVKADSLAGEKIVARLTTAPANGASIDGLKVVAKSGWFAARPSGTEEIYKIYAESFIDEAHLNRIIDEAQAIVSAAFKAAGV